MHNQSLHRRKTLEGFLQHILYLLHVWAERKVLRNDLVRVHIQNWRNITFPPRQFELRHIGRPFLQGVLGAKIALNNVVSNFANISFVRVIFLFRTLTSQRKPVHDSLNTLVIYAKATVQKLMVYSPYAVSFPILIEDSYNFRR